MENRTRAHFDWDAVDGLFRGVELVYRAAGRSLGSQGKNAVFRRWGQPFVTTDGITIAKKANPVDEVEKLGADIMKNALEGMNEEVGDGTTTTTVVTYHLLKSAIANLKSNSSKTAAKLVKQLSAALREAHSILDSKAIRVKSDEDLLKIARISYDDPEVAKMVVAAVNEAGQSGRVVIEESMGTEIEKVSVPGMEVEGGFASPAFVTGYEKQEPVAVMSNAYVAVTDKSLSSNGQIMTLLTAAQANGVKNLVIVCKDLQSEAFATVMQNKKTFYETKGERAINVIAVKAPKDQDTLDDLAVFCGKDRPVLDSASPRILNFNDLSKVRNVVAYKNKTLFVKGDRSPQEQEVLSERVSMLEGARKQAHGEDKSRLSDRIARATSSVVIIKVGSVIAADVPRLRLKIEDAKFAVQSAKREGYVAGGGITIRSVAAEVHGRLGTEGSRMLMEACEEPVRTLVECSGEAYDPSRVSDTAGFDTYSCEYVPDMVGRGIIDPVLVPKTVLKYAVETVGVVVNIDTAFEDVPVASPQQQ